MNAKTWGTCCGLSLFAFVGCALSILPAPSFQAPIRLGCTVVLVIAGLTGAFFGLCFAFGRLYMGCPFCHRRSKMTGGDRNHLEFECASCGDVFVTIRAFRAATAAKGTIASLDSNRRRELLDCSAGAERALLKTKRFWQWFIIAWLPCLAAIAWRIGVDKKPGPAIIGALISAGFTIVLTQSVLAGRVSSNQGTWFRETEPVRYWISMIVLGLIYGLCIVAILQAD